MKTRRIPLLLLGIALVLTTPLWLPEPSYQLHGSEILPASPAPDIVLTDHQNRTFRLSDEQGRVVLLFFGYTSCPDVCPATLGQLRQIRAGLAPEDSEQVRFVFITVDPERDTPARLRDYLDRIEPTTVGLTGTLQELQPVWTSFGVYREGQPAPDETVPVFAHSTRLYVVDMQGNLRLSYPFGAETGDIVTDVLHLIAEG